MRSSLANCLAVLTCTTLALGLTACAKTANNTSAGNGGASNASGAPASGKPLSDLNIGFFGPGTSNTYAADVTDSAAPKAKELGVKLTTVSGNFDVQTQVNQLQQALQRKTYNAWVVVPLDPNQECSILQQAVAAGIMVMMAVTPACTDSGPAGGIGVVAVQSEALYQQWWDYIFTHNKPGKIAFITGGALDFVTKASEDALKTEQAKYPGFTVVSNQNLDYSTEAAYKNAQDVIKAHPDISVFASNYSGMTQGVVQAVSQAGKTSSISVYDMDGDKTMVSFIKAGKVAMTVPGLPKSESTQAVQLVVDAWQGKSVAKISNPIMSQTFTGAPFVTKDNADSYQPEY